MNETEHLQISDRDDIDKLPIRDDEKERIREISEMFEDTSLITQNPRASGGGVSTSARASVDLHFHFDRSTNIIVQGDSALDRVKALFSWGGSDE